METNLENSTEGRTKSFLPPVELFKTSFDSYWKKKWTYAGIILFGFVGCVVLLPLGLIGLLISYKSFTHGDYNITLILIDILLGLISLLFIIFFSIWSRVALFLAVKDQDLKISESLKLGWPKLASFFWVGLLAGLAALGGFILLIIPGIIFSVWFCFSMYVFICEDLKGVEALKRSKQLVEGNWWPIFGRILVLMIVAILISWIKFFGPVFNIFVTAPFSVVYMYKLYQDLKGIKS